MKLSERVARLEETIKRLREQFEVEERSILTPKQAAEYLQISEEEVIQMCEEKRIPCAPIAGEYRLPRQLLDRWVFHLNDTYNSEEDEED